MSPPARTAHSAFATSQPGGQTAERSLILDRIPRELDRCARRHRGLLGVGREHHDHAIADLEQARDRMLEQGAALVLLRELVATEPPGPSAREHDARDAATVPGRRVSLDSARRRTRTGP